MRRFVHRHQPPPCVPCWAKAGLGAMAALGLIALTGELSGASLVVAPLGATAVLIYGMPESPTAQPVNVIGGHVLATLVSLAFVEFLPTHWWSLALAVGAVIVLMGSLRILHPPAGAMPLVVMTLRPDWTFVLTPVLAGSAALVTMAMVLHRLPPRPARYPLPPPDGA